MKKTIALILALVMCLSLCACGGVDQRYAELINCLDNNDYEGAVAQVMMLRQQAIDNGDIVLVEPQEEDYELVGRYQTVTWFLKNYSPEGYSSIYDQRQEKSLSGNEALAFCYNELKDLEGVDKWLDSEYFSFEDDVPTDRAALLNQFAIVENVLVKTTSTAMDNMGNENTSDYQTYFYDEAGTLTMENLEWSAAEQRWEKLITKSGYYRYSYGEAGKITGIKITDREGTNTYAVVTPTYDAAGNMISESIVDNNGEYLFTYSYDAAGNRIQMDYASDYYDYSILYTYDEAGRIIQKDMYRYTYPINDIQHTDCHEATVYTYDASGILTAASTTIQGFGWTYSGAGFEPYLRYEKLDTVTYTHDGEGRMIQEAWQYGQTQYNDGEIDKPDYISRVINYVYEDYYIFNPAN